ncbi:hypothetical protein G6L37_34575 [Agrobacterium rubi]|nr:hypothetical protein [Agrobacterium rubi]NTF23693.1 hypothetical protein [Agrobacterium rubi]
MPKNSENIALVAAALEPFHRGNDRLGVLLALCVGRLMLKEARDKDDWKDSFPQDKIRHVADWLRAAIVNGASWLDELDTQQRPKKLMKYGSFDRLLKDVDRSMVVEAQKLSNVKITAEDETVVAELADGMYLVRLETPAALDRESAEMQHCIGNGGYDDALDDGRWEYMSLRDKHGKAHATLEIDHEENRLEQLQGKQNKRPLPKYIEALVPYLKANRYRTDLRANEIGYVIDVNGHWHPLDNLPEGLRVPGSLHLSGVDIRKLPDGLRVGDCLYLVRSTIECLPRGLRVAKTLFIGNTSLTYLPDDISVGGSISMCVVKGPDAPIVDLPDSVDDRTRIVTSDGAMSAARFRERYARKSDDTRTTASP